MGGDKFTFKRPENTVSIFFYAQATISVQANPRGLKRKKKKAAGEGKERLASE